MSIRIASQLKFEPHQLLALAQSFADRQGTCLLYSGGNLDSATTSYLALFPYETISIQANKLVYRKGSLSLQKEISQPWEALQEFFPPSLDPLDYAFGFFGYEMGAFSDPTYSLPYRLADTPDTYWQRCALVIKVEHQLKQAQFILNEEALPFIFEELEQQGEESIPFVKAKDVPDRYALYMAKIAAIQEAIYAGDVYQVNLSQEFIFEGKQNPFLLFMQMLKRNPTPFSAYLHTPSFSIVSMSPERFLQKKGMQLETRPIKGTMARGRNTDEDLYLKEQLLHSSKEQAELLMITDLMRNDLGKISQRGSVVTCEIGRCEMYTNVFHLLSIIQSQALSTLSPLELIRACFPAGSITGCPKLKAMEMISQLEQRPRGIYTGSIGYMTGKGDFDLNVAIRTLVCTNQQLSLQLGGGIVIDSIPDQEYQETLIKGHSFFQMLREVG